MNFVTKNVAVHVHSLQLFPAVWFMDAASLYFFIYLLI